ncbi:hypothetical protein N9230_01285 [Akkermansiaceae bacterium]|nr:hypothetical protein [Akkermansiaceae bacterium]
MRTFTALALLLFLNSCAVRIEQANPSTSATSTPRITLPPWYPKSFADTTPPDARQFAPRYLALKEGEIASYGIQNDGTETFSVISERRDSEYSGIHPLRLCFLPTSSLAGKSPYLKDTNKLTHEDGRYWEYSSFDLRTTVFQLFPSKRKQAKGLLLYHTSIMLLSVVEEQFVHRMQKLGWNVMVGLPPDSLYRGRVPAMTSNKGTIANGARLLADDMDRHHAEQAYSTRAALAYLRKTRPSWLTEKKALIGTSAGSFGVPAEVNLNPDWDSIVLVSAGTNLLSAYEAGAAGVFPNTLEWVKDVRKDPPKKVTRILTDEEFHLIYRQASKLTKLHPGKIGGILRRYPLLTIHGRLDRIIPKNQTQELHNILGQPERWTYPLGHHLIAVQLVLDAKRIDRWLTQ